MQEVILEGTPEAQAALRGRDSLTLSGSLEYQACDDKLCFNPVSLPVSWTLTLSPSRHQSPVRIERCHVASGSCGQHPAME